ncbi:hypothetical protein FNV43_RR00654 [Rhamnella rubrinervis]|uniref:Uncharacterized protein n=1 Tax=Rhamnella rubrinervis TaxID=2594499 RepID=A0A8K0HP00_9ROSA|nr:hypothetical protein FNV43_RR00654 [Rhamnella rubrinervis]
MLLTPSRVFASVACDTMFTPMDMVMQRLHVFADVTDLKVDQSEMYFNSEKDGYRGLMREWIPELQRRFVSALHQLGGSQDAKYGSIDNYTTIFALCFQIGLMLKLSL